VRRVEIPLIDEELVFIIISQGGRPCSKALQSALVYNPSSFHQRVIRCWGRVRKRQASFNTHVDDLESYLFLNL
jgi:hypothetical protein